MRPRSIHIVPLAVVVILALCAYRAYVPIVVLQDTNRIILPPNLKQHILDDPKSELLYVDFHNRKIEYFFRSENTDRMYAMLKTLQKMAVSLRYTIPDGNYLFFLHDGAHHKTQWPVLATAAAQSVIDSKHAFLIPDKFALNGYWHDFARLNRAMAKYPWQKKIGKVFWRGSAFGVGPECNDINGCDRFRFMHYTHALDFVDAAFTSYTDQMNPELLARLSALYSLKKMVSPAESMAYRYLIDVDGNSCGYPRMAWILYSNSLLMKHKSDKLQWYYPQMQPYVHYLPINEDFSNLQDSYMWAEAHPKAAQKIANNGHRFAAKIFRLDNMLRSMQQALIRYHEHVNQLNPDIPYEN